MVFMIHLTAIHSHFCPMSIGILELAIVGLKLFTLNQLRSVAKEPRDQGI